MSVRATTRAWDVGIVLALAIAALLFWKLRIFDPALDEPFYRNLTNVDFFTYEVPVGAAAGEALRQVVDMVIAETTEGLDAKPRAAE